MGNAKWVNIVKASGYNNKVLQNAIKIKKPKLTL